MTLRLCPYCTVITPRRLCYFHARTLERLRVGRCIDCGAVLGPEDAAGGHRRLDGGRGNSYCAPCRDSRRQHGMVPDPIVADYWAALAKRRAAA